MKKGLIIWIIIGVVVLGVAAFFLFQEEEEKGFCAEFDGDEEACLSNEECVWVSEENICNEIDGDDDEGEDQPVKELEKIEVPETVSNQICKMFPLEGLSDYDSRYLCLAIVNNDERFCEGINEENEKLICLALANTDSSYCEELTTEEASKNCYYHLAVYSENASFCDEINYHETDEENTHEKEQCYYNFMSNLYQWNKSEEIKTEYCEGLDYPDSETCLALKERNITICGDNPNCLTHFDQPLSFCDTEDLDYVSCIKDRAKMSQNVSICNLLSGSDKDTCYGVYCTHIDLDINTCNEIEDPNKRQEMLTELAIVLRNW